MEVDESCTPNLMHTRQQILQTNDKSTTLVEVPETRISKHIPINLSQTIGQAGIGPGKRSKECALYFAQSVASAKDKTSLFPINPSLDYYKGNNY